MSAKRSAAVRRDTVEPGPRTAADLIPPKASLSQLRAIAADCTACPLYAGATQTVFGEGPAHAPLMLVGETPGDREDLAGHPFVGPAGRLLDRCLEAAGIERSKAYVTNVVKHFKWTPRGKRRLHAKPNAREINACRPWLEAEINAIQPRLIVCLGATAAQGLLGRDFRITRERGKPMPSQWAPQILATYHPSAILRAPDPESRHRMHEEFLHDLGTAAKLLSKLRS
jgi:uracil-DNA glycosylase family protein